MWLVSRIKNKLCGLPMEFLSCLATYGLARRIAYELCGWQVEFLRHSAMYGLASRIRYEAMWLASGTPEAFDYAGYEKVSYGAMWEANERYLAMRAGHFDEVGCYVAGK